MGKFKNAGLNYYSLSQEDFSLLPILLSNARRLFLTSSKL